MYLISIIISCEIESIIGKFKYLSEKSFFLDFLKIKKLQSSIFHDSLVILLYNSNILHSIL